MYTNVHNFVCARRVRLCILICFIAAIGLLLPPSVHRGIAASGTSTPVQAQASAKPLPRPDHIVIVIEENKGFDDVFSSECPPNSGRPCASYFISLAAQGASLEEFFAFHHPSQPNYIELFSGSNQGIIGDCCPVEKCQPQDTCNTDCDPTLSPPFLKGPSLPECSLKKIDRSRQTVSLSPLWVMQRVCRKKR